MAGAAVGSGSVEGWKSATGEDLRNFLAATFAKWQLPDAFVFLETIPRTSVGKFKKTALREQFANWKWEGRTRRDF